MFQNKPNISNETYGAFFSHISTIVGEMRNKTKEEVFSIVEFVLPFISAIRPSKLQKEPEELYNKIFASRGMITNSRYSSYPEDDTQTLFVSEYEDDEDASKLIIDFICQIHAITDNNTKTETEIEALVDSHRTYINSKLIQLLSNGFTLVSLFDVIILDDNYSSDESIKLIDNCLTQKNKDGNLYLRQDQINTMINSLLDNIAEPNAVELITKIIGDETLKTVVTKNIINRDSDFTNSLPEQLLALAVGMYNNESADTYATNYTYLRIIAEKGNASQKTVLVKSLINDIDTNHRIEDVISILEVVNIQNQNDKGLILAHLNSNKEQHSQINTEITSKLDAMILKYRPAKVDDGKKNKSK